MSLIDIPMDGDNPYMRPLPPPPKLAISDEGVRLIKSFEGYHRKLPNGGCVAYQTALGGGKYDIPTIGYGCTQGVTMGMTWTLKEAEAALRREIAKHEAYVTQLVTIEINQNEYDSLTSFCYNCGPGNLKKLIVPLNKGDRAGTVRALSRYTRAQGRVLPGLVARRTREAALFQKPVVAPSEPMMPQSGITASPEPIGPAKVATAATAGVGAVSTTVPLSWWQQLHDSFSQLLNHNAPGPQTFMDTLGNANSAAPQVKSLLSDGLLTYALIAGLAYLIICHGLPYVFGGKNA